MIGGPGADLLNGGRGEDTADYGSSQARVNAYLNQTGNGGDAAGDRFESIENLRGSRFDDQLGGNQDDNRLWGLGGADRLYGGGGNDRLVGGPGDDELYGGAGEDTLSGGAGHDLLYGGDDYDRVEGGEAATTSSAAWPVLTG